MRILLILLILIIIKLIHYIYYASDFGESSLELSEKEYDEFCKSYQKEFEEKGNEGV